MSSGRAGTFLSEVNNRETIAVIEVNNATYCLQKVPAVQLDQNKGKSYRCAILYVIIFSSTYRAFESDAKELPAVDASLTADTQSVGEVLAVGVGVDRVEGLYPGGDPHRVERGVRGQTEGDL